MASTRFVLQVRSLQVGDLNPTIPFVPEPDDYFLYLDALQNDISAIHVVDAVTRTDSVFKISTSTSISEAELRKFLKSLFGDNYFDKLRCTLLTEA